MPSHSALILAFVFFLPATVRSAGFEENFSNVSDGDLLTTIAGWENVGGGEDTWTVSSFTAFEGGAVEAGRAGKYQLKLPARGFSIRAEDGPFTFRAKIQITSPVDSYADIRLDLCKSDQVHGIGLSFRGGKKKGIGDNTILLSEGGPSWGVIKYRAVANTQWNLGEWYQVELNDVRFGGDGVTATATVYPVDDPSSKLVDAEEIKGYGKGNPGTLDLLRVSSIGTGRSFALDDIQIVPGN